MKLFYKIYLGLVFAFTSTSAFAAELSCNFPIKASDTAKSLQAKFGKDAKLQDIGGPEGTSVKGIVIYPNSPQKRLEVILNEKTNKVESILVRNPKSTWTIKGLKMGSNLKEALAVNKAPISMQGFGWDYGGFTTNYHHGKLDKANNCIIGLRFDDSKIANVPDTILGDKIINSDMKDLQKANPIISEISVAPAR